MRHVKPLVLLLICAVMLSLTGCGSGSSGSSTGNNPFSSTTAQNVDGTTPTTTSTPPQGTTNQDVALTLTTDLAKPTDLSVLPQVDVNTGTVLLTAKLVNTSDGATDSSGQQTSGSQPVPDQPITFRVIAGPGTIGFSTNVSDQNGLVEAVFTTGNVLSTTNVIIEASTTLNGNVYRAYNTFQIVRGSSVIMFTDQAGLKPGGQSNMLDSWSKDGVDPAITPSVSVLQLLPFKVTDSNGNPRVGVPITLSVYSITSLNPDDITVDFLVSPVAEPNQRTITTDSSGMGIFNVAVTLQSPAIGSFTASSVVFKATTNDAIPVTAYVGGSYSLTAKLPPTPTIAPSAASFGTNMDLLFGVSGGTKPYSVSSSNPSRVTATVQEDGSTVMAHLADTSSWTGSVMITVTDFFGQTTTASVSR